MHVVALHLVGKVSTHTDLLHLLWGSYGFCLYVCFPFYSHVDNNSGFHWRHKAMRCHKLKATLDVICGKRESTIIPFFPRRGLLLETTKEFNAPNSNAFRSCPLSVDILRDINICFSKTNVRLSGDPGWLSRYVLDDPGFISRWGQERHILSKMF